jgi:hypothetical protein
VIETCIVLAKRPVAGRVKTRLVPALTYADAADIAAAALRDTLVAVQQVAARRHVLAFDGRPCGWTPPGWHSVQQVSGGLDRRLVGAFAAAGHGPTVLVGMDTPQLQPAQLAAFDPTRFDACLGRTRDGGFWAIGFRDPSVAAAAILDVPMSTRSTGALQQARLDALGMRTQALDRHIDVDTIDDLIDVAGAVPEGYFGRAVASLYLSCAGHAS